MQRIPTTKTRQVKPYYESADAVIYLGDCEEILPDLEDG